MRSSLLQVNELAAYMQERPITLLRAVMDDPVTQKPDTRSANVLPASVDFDLDGEGSDHTTHLPHSLPSAHALSLYLGRQGVTSNTPIAVYDTRGIYSAPRVWWMLKAMGHKDVFLLDGGQPAWQSAGLPTSEQQQYGNLSYQANVQSGWFVDADTVQQALGTHTQLLDARSAPRFYGEVSEPRAGLRSGHMPGAINLPFDTLLKDGHFLSIAQLQTVFQRAKVDVEKPIICTCGSGITACIIGFAALMCGAKHVAVYDGSWSQWGADPRYEVTTQ
ncbi:sulfurtransferase [Alteromonas sp. D210916BOD_24]|uniref:sulfurtransferase n=1 Tax=Alteromonas sp. D210916BOD_24 TaxID=3157618 RepID=UPI00399CD5D3